MRSDASSNNAKFNRKSVISSHSTGSSNNEVNIWMKWKREIANKTKWNVCHSINRRRVPHLQQIKTTKHHNPHRNQPNNSNNNCRPIIAHRWAAIRIFLWKQTSRKSILVRSSKCQHLVMETYVFNGNYPMSLKILPFQSYRILSIHDLRISFKMLPSITDAMI